MGIGASGMTRRPNMGWPKFGPIRRPQPKGTRIKQLFQDVSAPRVCFDRIQLICAPSAQSLKKLFKPLFLTYVCGKVTFPRMSLPCG
jgi:hypothetical protein